MLTPFRYSYRSFDRQWILPDSRLGDYLRPSLWHVYSDNQVYFTGLLTKPLGNGPALTVCSGIPDLDHFSNRGAKDAIPLYLDKQADKTNIMSGLLELLGDLTPEDLAGYVYCLLAHSEYTIRFADELANREVRVPLTKNTKLFSEAAEFGKELIWLHTYGERFHNSIV
jgi:predicted helicase